MPKAAEHHILFRAAGPDSPRRAFLGRLAAIGAASAVVHVGVPAASAAAPDAELLSLIAEFDPLERRYSDLLESAHEDVDEEPYVSINARQVDLLPPILAARARTRAGVVARARMLALCDPDLLEREQDYGPQKMMSALVRDLLAMGGDA